MNTDDRYQKFRPPASTPDDEICHCVGLKPVKLMSAALGFNPIHCLDCNLEVPPERLAPSDDLVDAIAFWAQTCGAIDRLWLASGPYEVWAAHELSNIDSPVNKEGREVASGLNKLRRCYYWYHQDQSVQEFHPVTKCPACGRQFSLYTLGIFTQQICESCSIVTVGE